MKVLIKFNHNVHVLENVGLDDKCLPVVEGKPPYQEAESETSSRGTSPLVFESVLWFKTLALEAIYIDCHKRLVYWTPLAASTQEAQKQTLPESTSNESHFVPSTARPLFTDKSVYDFDATPKEMMITCFEVSRQFVQQSMSTEEFHRSIARILHVYILPEVVFVRDDIDCLSAAKSQIENRFSKAEADIKSCATVAENLKQCLSKMIINLLDKENMDNETYLRSCRKEFQVAFLKVVTFDIDNLNTELSAAQNNLNWARKHSGNDQQLADLKARRDRLFIDIDKRIMARESLKNVIMRRQLTKKKVKKLGVKANCVHNVFIEVLKKLEEQDLILCRLGKDKVSICAAREAVLSTIAEISDNSHNRNNSTKFDLNNFIDGLQVDRKVVDKPGGWLTIQERVASLLNDDLSVPFVYHVSGCKELTSRICFILSGLLATPGSAKVECLTHLHKSPKVGHAQYLSLNDLSLSGQEFSEKANHTRNETMYREGVFGHFSSQQQVTDVQTLGTDAVSYMASENSKGCSQKVISRSRSVGVLKGSQCGICDKEFSMNWHKQHRRTAVLSEDDLTKDKAATHELEHSTDSGICGEAESIQKGRHHVLKQQQRGSMFLESIDNLRDLIQVHFRDIIDCLNQELEREENWGISFQEHQELLWKSYQPFFCQELHEPLLQLYTEGFGARVSGAYANLCGISVQEILDGDKLLDLYFERNTSSRNTGMVSIACPRQPSSQSFTGQRSVAGVCCINDLYCLINGDYHHESYLGGTKLGEDGIGKSYLSTSPSIDEGLGNSSSSFSSSPFSSSPFSSSVKSNFSVTSLDEDILDNFGGQWKTESSPETVGELFKSVFSSFRLHINKCLASDCFLDKVRFIIKAIEVLNRDISLMFGAGYVSACDDIISMLVLALCHISEDMFVDLYVNLRLLMDALPSFLTGSLWDFNLVSLCASYDYLFTFRMCDHVMYRGQEL